MDDCTILPEVIFENKPQKVKKTSLASAAHTLSYIYECMDSEYSEDVSSKGLTEVLSYNLQNINEAVDRRKYLIREIDSKLALARQVKKEIDAEIKKYERITKNVVENTIQIMHDNESVIFKDSFGKKLSIGVSPNPKLLLDFDVTQDTTYNILSNIDVKYLVSIGMEKYINSDTIYSLDTNAVKQDLKDGVELPFAKLDDKKVLRGLR